METAMKAMREKTWDEMNDHERIERLRRELRSALTTIQALSAMYRQLQRHVHVGDQIAYLHQSNDEGRPYGYRHDPLA